MPNPNYNFDYHDQLTVIADQVQEIFNEDGANIQFMRDVFKMLQDRCNKEKVPPPHRNQSCVFDEETGNYF